MIGNFTTSSSNHDSCWSPKPLTYVSNRATVDRHTAASDCSIHGDAMTQVPTDHVEESYEATVRQMITTEDALTNQRMLWMAAFNGLLFAALGFAWDKADT